MKDDSASYYDSQEFADLLKLYETMLADGSSVYFDSMDIANLAEYYTISGDLDKSDAVIAYGLTLHPGDADILIAKAGSLLARGHKDQARVISESVTDPDNQELLYLKGVIELADDNAALADTWFTQAVVQSDNDPGMLNDIIVKFMDARQFDLCQKWLDMALVLSPDSRNFIELQADLFFDTAQMDTAIEWYNHLLDEFAYDTYYWEQLGRIYYEKTDYTQAKECFEFIEAIEPENKQAKMMKAGCLFSLEDWNSAFSIYSALLDEDRNDYTLQYYCGRCMYEQDRYDEALPYFQSSLEELMLDNETPEEMLVELYTLIADCAHNTGRDGLAAQCLYSGLAINPDEPELKELAVRILPASDAALFTDNNKD